MPAASRGATVRQRNDTGYVQQVRAWPTDDYPDHVPFDVGSGEEIDFPRRVGAFTLLDPEPGAETGTAETPDPSPAAKPARKGAAAKSADTGAEGGEPA